MNSIATMHRWQITISESTGAPPYTTFQVAAKDFRTAVDLGARHAADKKLGKMLITACEWIGTVVVE